MSESLLVGLKLINIQEFQDERGNLLPVSFEDLFVRLGAAQFLQLNIATSNKGVIRGMHWQNTPKAQGKLIIVLSGKIIDVAIDVRQNSATFGQFSSVELDEKDQKAFWIPPGFAHGFQTISDSSKVIYLVDAPFDLISSDGINPLDKEMVLPWDYSIEPILSQKDSTAQDFSKKFR